MRKYYFSIVLILTVIISSACTSNTTDGGRTPPYGNDNVERNNSADLTSNDESRFVFKSEDGNELSISVDDQGGLDLPQGYPAKLVPIIEDSAIVTSSRSSKEGKIFLWVSLLTDKSVKDAFKYYQSALNTAKNKEEVSLNGMYSISGLLEDSEICVIVTDYNSDSKAICSVNISIERAE